MIHWHYIGYFDPRQPIDLAVRPARPKIVRPVSLELASELASRFGVAEHVEILDGYLCSHLGMFGMLHPFEAALVEKGCVVMTEMFEVVQPPDAVFGYREFLENYWAAHEIAERSKEAESSPQIGPIEVRARSKCP
jgi:hypothetical protein